MKQTMKLGVEVLIENSKLVKTLRKQRVGLVCHPASVNHELKHSFDLIQEVIGLSSAFGPQHGAKGDKQDNMIETDDELHLDYEIPIFSLYGRHRRPTKEMLETFDVLLFDLQDLGCRIYTFVTTLLYVMEECEKAKKKLIILDRPNPAGREVEGFRLRTGFESFVGAAPIPMRHGLTVGELALYFKKNYDLKLDLEIIKMKGYSPNKGPNFGWPAELTWINPSPNAANLNMARVYSGSVMIEGTTLSEGRGTTRPLEVVGAPELDFKKILARMKKIAPKWTKGMIPRECYFEPTFHKHVGALCSGIHLHTDHSTYNHKQFKPYRFFALMLKCLLLEYPDYELFRDFPYEYVTDKLAFDVINGGIELRSWIENTAASVADLEKALIQDEKSWLKESKEFLLYK